MSNERGGGAKVNPDDRRSGCRTGDDEYPSPSHQRNTGTGDDRAEMDGPDGREATGQGSENSSITLFYELNKHNHGGH
jgi:hypothetical protein